MGLGNGKEWGLGLMDVNGLGNGVKGKEKSTEDTIDCRTEGLRREAVLENLVYEAGVLGVPKTRVWCV